MTASGEPVLVVAGWCTSGIDVLLVRAVAEDGRPVPGCHLVSTQQIGFGNAVGAEYELRRPDGAVGFEAGRGLHRLRLSCPGRRSVTATVLALRGRSNVFQIAVPAGRS